MAVTKNNKGIALKNYSILVGSALLVAALYTLVVALKIWGNGSDYIEHAAAAERMINGGKVPPHFLFQIFLIIVYKATGIAYLQASLVVTFALIFMAFVFAYKNIQGGKIAANAHLQLLCLAVMFLLFSHPVAILSPFDGHMYYGYIASNVYHNPSILVLKLFALLHFTLLCKLLDHYPEQNRPGLSVLLLAVLTALSIIAKPNYIIVLLPALCGLFLIKLFKTEVRMIKWSIVAYGIIAPACCVLLWQYLHFYGDGNDNSIRVGFFEIYKIQSKLWTIIPKLIASIAFPISVVAVLRRRLIRQHDFMLGALMLLVALIYSYCLVDSVGGGTGAGNFWWSAQIAHFILLFVCIKAYIYFLLESSSSAPKSLISMHYFPLYVGVGQFISGIIWFLTNSIHGFLSW